MKKIIEYKATIRRRFVEQLKKDQSYFRKLIKVDQSKEYARGRIAEADYLMGELDEILF